MKIAIIPNNKILNDLNVTNNRPLCSWYKQTARIHRRVPVVRLRGGARGKAVVSLVVEGAVVADRRVPDALFDTDPLLAPVLVGDCISGNSLSLEPVTPWAP